MKNVIIDGVSYSAKDALVIEKRKKKAAEKAIKKPITEKK